MQECLREASMRWRVNRVHSRQKGISAPLRVRILKIEGIPGRYFLNANCNGVEMSVTYYAGLVRTRAGEMGMTLPIRRNLAVLCMGCEGAFSVLMRLLNL